MAGCNHSYSNVGLDGSQEIHLAISVLTHGTFSYSVPNGCLSNLFLKLMVRKNQKYAWKPVPVFNCLCALKGFLMPNLNHLCYKWSCWLLSLWQRKLKTIDHCNFYTVFEDCCFVLPPLITVIEVYIHLLLFVNFLVSCFSVSPSTLSSLSVSSEILVLCSRNRFSAEVLYVPSRRNNDFTSHAHPSWISCAFLLQRHCFTDSFSPCSLP